MKSAIMSLIVLLSLSSFAGPKEDYLAAKNKVDIFTLREEIRQALVDKKMDINKMTFEMDYKDPIYPVYGSDSKNACIVTISKKDRNKYVASCWER